MLSDEEYRKEVTRYFDSIREKESSHRGEQNCIGAHCELCMFHIKRDCFSGCNKGIHDAVKCVQLVEEWSKSHPKVSVMDKFKSVMEEVGIKYTECSLHNGIPNYACRAFNSSCDECTKYWESEYKPPLNESESLAGENRNMKDVPQYGLADGYCILSIERLK